MYDFTWLAGFNLLLGMVVVIVLLLRTSYRWNEYPYEVRLLFLSLIIVLFALIEASAEQFTGLADATYSTLAITFSKLFVAFGLWKTRGALYRTGERGLKDNTDEHNVNKDI